jgi:glycosyltransferase involved in cell wall biosynthesis
MRVWHQCRRRGIRHLHVHFANVSADVAMLVAEFGGEGWTWSFTMHGPTEFSDVEAHRLRQKAEDAEFVACISDYARSQLLAIADPGRWHRFVVARLGVVPQEPRTRPGGEPPNFLVVGQLARRKGHDVLLHALARLRHEARLTIVGDGPERERLERLASELGVRDRVSFEGARGQHELRGYYEAADVFCLPSFQEGLPVVLMEAMAFGVPVVATRIMGVPELVDDGVSGVLVTAARVDELATALDELLDDPARAEAIGRVGRERVRREYDLEANVGRLSELLTRADAEAAR